MGVVVLVALSSSRLMRLIFLEMSSAVFRLDLKLGGMMGVDGGMMQLAA